MVHQPQHTRSGRLAGFRRAIAEQTGQLDALVQEGEQLDTLALQAEVLASREAAVRALVRQVEEAERALLNKDRLLETLWRDKNAQARELERYALRLERTVAEKNEHMAEKDRYIATLEAALARIERSLPARLYYGLARLSRFGRRT